MYMYPWLYTCTCTHGYIHVHVPMVIYMYIHWTVCLYIFLYIYLHISIFPKVYVAPSLHSLNMSSSDNHTHNSSVIVIRAGKRFECSNLCSFAARSKLNFSLRSFAATQAIPDSVKMMYLVL